MTEGRAHRLAVLRRVRARRRRPARRPPGDHPLDVRRRAGRAVPGGRGRPPTCSTSTTGSVLTSAGTAAGIDLCLHIVRLDHGAEVANVVARRMVVPPHRDGGQAQFVAAPVPRVRGDDPLATTLDWASRTSTKTSPWRPWRDGRRCRRARSPAASSPPRARRRCSGCSASGCSLAQRLLETHRPAHRARGRALRLRHRRQPAHAVRPASGHDADRLPPHLPRRGPTRARRDVQVRRFTCAVSGAPFR